MPHLDCHSVFFSFQFQFFYIAFTAQTTIWHSIQRYFKVVLFAFEIDDTGKFTMDKWWLPRFSSQRGEILVSFQWENKETHFRNFQIWISKPQISLLALKACYCTLICQLSSVLNRSLNVLKQGRVEITHNWIMNKRTINCIY